MDSIITGVLRFVDVFPQEKKGLASTVRFPAPQSNCSQFRIQSTRRGNGRNVLTSLTTIFGFRVSPSSIISACSHLDLPTSNGTMAWHPYMTSTSFAPSPRLQRRTRSGKSLLPPSPVVHPRPPPQGEVPGTKRSPWRHAAVVAVRAGRRRTGGSPRCGGEYWLFLVSCTREVGDDGVQPLHIF